MKDKSQYADLELGLQNISQVDVETIINSQKQNLFGTLELTMTNSAFGYEYALKALEDEGEYGVKAEQIKVEIENLKNAYFDARLQMVTLDASRLEKFETLLIAEKSVLFSKSAYLH